MTVEEFKILCPDKAHWVGEPLWNAMEEYMLYHPQLQSKEQASTRQPLTSHRFIILDFSEYDETELNIKHGKV